MAAYLLTYGISQLFYGPLSDRVGRRPVILVGMSIFMLATLVAITTHSLPVLIAASAMQGMGTGVGGVMARTLPRDLYEGAQLRHANSLLNMGILVSPLIAPLLGGILDTLWSWRACYAFLLVLCAGVTFSMAKWMPETRPEGAPRTKLLASYKTLFGTGAFNCYLLMLIGGFGGDCGIRSLLRGADGRGARPEQHGGEYSVYSADPGGVLRGVVCRPPQQAFPDPDVAVGDLLPAGGSDDVDRGCWAS